MLKKFVKWLIIVSLIAINGCYSSTTQNVNTPASLIYADAITNLESNTVAIVTVDHNKSVNIHCAGVWVSDDVIITSAHCVENPTFNELLEMLGKDFIEKHMPEINLKANDIKYIVSSDISNVTNIGIIHPARNAKVLLYDKGKDIAILHAPGAPKHTVAIISRDTIRYGDDVHIMGHKIGYWWSYSKGYISKVRIQTGPMQESVKVIQVDGTVWLGNSGGGAFNKKGELIGICAYIDKRGPGLSFFIHRDIILNALKRANVMQ